MVVMVMTMTTTAVIADEFSLSFIALGYALTNPGFDVFLTVHHSIDFSKYQLSAQFF